MTFATKRIYKVTESLKVGTVFETPSVAVHLPAVRSHLMTLSLSVVGSASNITRHAELITRYNVIRKSVRCSILVSITDWVS